MTSCSSKIPEHLHENPATFLSPIYTKTQQHLHENHTLSPIASAA